MQLHSHLKLLVFLSGWELWCYFGILVLNSDTCIPSLNDGSGRVTSRELPSWEIILSKHPFAYAHGPISPQAYNVLGIMH